MENLTLNLIRNTYDVDESKVIINRLLEDKIKFIQNQLFSLQERFGIDSPFLRQRVIELKSSKIELENFYNEIKNNEDFEVRINCPIDIELISKNENGDNKELKKLEKWT